jgi:PHP family Zn ribbon phosphoesterase
MKYLRSLGIPIISSLILVLGYSPLVGAYEDTQCFKCHTSAKKLIEITREIAKTRPAAKSAETAGEG